MSAVAIYLQGLREGQRLSRARVADLVQSTENTIWRVETGRQEPGAGLLLSLVRVLKGKWEDIDRLAAPDVTDADARALAEARIRALASTLPNDRRASLAEQLRQMADDIDRQGL